MIVHHGLERMIGREEDVFFYITVMNENYEHPEMPQGVEEGIIKGMYKFKAGAKGKHRVQLLGSGAILQEVLEAQKLLEDYDIAADVWSVTSFNELTRDGLDVERHNLYHPESKKQSYVEQCLDKAEGPVIAATDYVKLYSEQIRNWVKAPYICLGTDGYGRSDTREALRRHFEVDRFHIAYTAIAALVREGRLDAKVALDAKKKYQIKDCPNPAYC